MEIIFKADAIRTQTRDGGKRLVVTLDIVSDLDNLRLRQLQGPVTVRLESDFPSAQVPDRPKTAECKATAQAEAMRETQRQAFRYYYDYLVCFLDPNPLPGGTLLYHLVDNAFYTLCHLVLTPPPEGKEILSRSFEEVNSAQLALTVCAACYLQFLEHSPVALPPTCRVEVRRESAGFQPSSPG